MGYPLDPHQNTMQSPEETHFRRVLFHGEALRCAGLRGLSPPPSRRAEDGLVDGERRSGALARWRQPVIYLRYLYIFIYVIPGY